MTDFERLNETPTDYFAPEAEVAKESRRLTAAMYVGGTSLLAAVAVGWYSPVLSGLLAAWGVGWLVYGWMTWE